MQLKSFLLSYIKRKGERERNEMQFIYFEYYRKSPLALGWV